MSTAYDPDHLATAISRFRGFFGELREVFVERDEVLTQLSLALLSRQHVLMTGPPGTGKSQLAHLTLGRIIDETAGAPSLFSRQFTENTVQTDLIGPVDFKTLMESGRTEHFTEEGMLGSVHAFLDEVFDGRDMLLRSTLNLLHEREVKQGTTIAKGRIECAVMTSNRYIAEILETARDTLLAFVDRVSFISFIPRGFADPQSLATVVKRHGGGFGRYKPSAYLSIQDLDVLQAAADLTYVPEELCATVAGLVAALDEELAEAQRSDPGFQPTRYLSTRSAVQATSVLRAAVVLDKIFDHPQRPLQARHEDLEMLRHFFLLGGVPHRAITALAERETDPRERRQLDIMATEAEVFDRCYARLPRTQIAPKGQRPGMEQLEVLARQARRSADPDALDKAVKTLIAVTQDGGPEAERAAKLLVDTVGDLSRDALRGGLTPELPSDDTLDGLGRQLGELASRLEYAPGQGRVLAQWLRGRLLRLVDDSLQLTVVPSGATVGVLAAPKPAALTQQIDALLQRADSIAALRRRLRDDEAASLGPGGIDPVWEQSLVKLEDELSLLWDAKFRLAAQQLLRSGADVPLDQMLRNLRPVLAQLRRDIERSSALGRPSGLLRRVVGPRLEPLVERAFLGIDGRDRVAFVRQVDGVATELHGAGLGEAVSADRFVAWSLPVLLRDGGAMSEAPALIIDRNGYDAATAADPALSITETLTRVALCTQPRGARANDAPTEATAAVWHTLRSLPTDDQRKVVQVDLARVRRGLERLSSWWKALCDATESERDDPGARSMTLLEAVVQSGYLRAVRGDGEPLRLAAQLRHVIEAFPSSAEAATRLREQLEQLEQNTTRVLVGLLEGRAERAWSEVLRPEGDA